MNGIQSIRSSSPIAKRLQSLTFVTVFHFIKELDIYQKLNKTGESLSPVLGNTDHSVFPCQLLPLHKYTLISMVSIQFIQ